LLEATSAPSRGAEDLIHNRCGSLSGASVGALVNLLCDLGGIHACTLGPVNTNSGVGFAIPDQPCAQCLEQYWHMAGFRRGLLVSATLTRRPAEFGGMKLTVSQEPGDR